VPRHGGKPPLPHLGRPSCPVSKPSNRRPRKIVMACQCTGPAGRQVGWPGRRTDYRHRPGPAPGLPQVDAGADGAAQHGQGRNGLKTPELVAIEKARQRKGVIGTHGFPIPDAPERGARPPLLAVLSVASIPFGSLPTSGSSLSQIVSLQSPESILSPRLGEGIIQTIREMPFISFQRVFSISPRGVAAME
jgi:hypothetical protein